MKAVPKEELYKVEVRESSESLAKIDESERVKLLSDHKYLIPELRQTVRDMLYSAAHNLPDGLSLLVVTAYRPRRMQEELWKQRFWQMAKRNPFMAMLRPRRFKRMVGKYTAPPGGSSHQCGAAVDVTIVRDDGTRLDMGALLTDYGEKVHTEYQGLTDEQKKNRKLLYDTMISAGFVNYPLEWWHYSYGDRHWAVYTGKIECQYGFLEDKKL